MKYCMNCGNEMDDDAKFCQNCGTAAYKTINNDGMKRKTVYEGEIHKCPNCGSTINAYEMVCETCGYEIRGRQITSQVHKLALKLEKTNNPQKKDELIRTFYIPNTKEEIYEFFILASSYIKIGGMNTNAWMVKIEQAYQKAELSFGNTSEFKRLKSMYIQIKKMNQKNYVFNFFKSNHAWALLFFIIGILFFLIYSASNNENLGTIGLMFIVVAAWIVLLPLVIDKK